MKKLINEIKRMQQLAGIITESEYQEEVMKVEDSNRSNTLFTLEVLPEFWKDFDIKRPASSFGGEAGMSYLSRDNTIQLTPGAEPVEIYRKDARMYDDKGQKAGRGDDSIFYKMKIFKTNSEFNTPEENNIIRYTIFAQDNKDAKLGSNMNLKQFGEGRFKSDEVGSIDDFRRFKIVAVK